MRRNIIAIVSCGLADFLFSTTATITRYCYSVSSLIVIDNVQRLQFGATKHAHTTILILDASKFQSYSHILESLKNTEYPKRKNKTNMIRIVCHL